MAINHVTAYLNFNGTAAKAIALYEKALGAKAENVMRFADAPPMGNELSADDKNRVMHATLRIGQGTIMMSDGMPHMKIPTESNAHVCLDFDNVEELDMKFKALAEGGTITMPLENMFWGARFGMLTDAFSIHWMFNCELKKKA